MAGKSLREAASRFRSFLEERKVHIALGGTIVALILLYPPRLLSSGPTVERLVEIVYMGPGGPIGGSMEDAVREFERLSDEAHARDPSKPVYRVISGQNAARDQVADPTRFLVSVAGGMSPDVIWFDRFAVAEWAARGAFEPLDPYIEKDLKEGRPDAIRPESFYASCWDEARYQGKVYGIPNCVDDRALLYNRDLLRRAGLVDSSGEARPPADWDELLEYAIRLTEWELPSKVVISGAELLRRAGLTDEHGAVRGPRDKVELARYMHELKKLEAEGAQLKVVGFAPNYGNSWLYIYGWMNGGEFMSEDGRTCTLNEPRIVEALEYMRDIYDALGGYARVDSFQAGFQGGALDPFIQGKIAMKIDGSWQMSVLAFYGRDLDFGVAGPPLSKREIARGRKTVSWSGGWAYAIPVAARNKEAAWEFIRFMMSERALAIRLEAERAVCESQGRLYIPGQIPIVSLNEWAFEKYVFSNPLIPKKYKDGCRVFNDLLPVARYRPVTPVGQRLWNEHVSRMQEALYHAKSPKQALDEGAKVVQKDLDRFFRPVQGRPVNWTWFFVCYPLILAGLAIAVYLWDTHRDFRSRLIRWLRLKGRSSEGVIEGSKGGYFRKQWYEGFVCALPWLVGFAIFGGGPMLFSILMSFCDYDILNPPRLIGFDNYKWMFLEDEKFLLSLWNTAYMVIGVPLGMAVSLAVALLLNLKIRGISVWRTFFYLPAIVPMVAASILWIWIFNPQGGLINKLLALVGIEGPLWLQDARWSKPSLILMGLWGSGSGMIIWLAGLKGINTQLYEAASVDGANAWQRFWYITIPQLSPYIFFNLVMGLIGTFQIFGSAFIMTQGGPADSTLFYVYHLFNNAFRYGHMGYASAMAWVLFIIVLALTIVQMRLSSRWVYYESE